MHSKYGAVCSIDGVMHWDDHWGISVVFVFVTSNEAACSIREI